MRLREEPMHMAIFIMQLYNVVLMYHGLPVVTSCLTGSDRHRRHAIHYAQATLSATR